MLSYWNFEYSLSTVFALWSPWNGEFGATGMIAEPLNICSPPSNDVSGKFIVTMDEGSCSYSERARIAQEAGAVALAIVGKVFDDNGVAVDANDNLGLG